MNVTGALIERDPANVQKLSGKVVTQALLPADDFLPGAGDSTKVGAKLQPVPGCKDLLLYPFAQTHVASAERCRKMGKRCGMEVEVELPLSYRLKFWRSRFWMFFKEYTGGVPGQSDDWWRASLRESLSLCEGDSVVIVLENDNLLRVYIESQDSRSPSQERAERMKRYSWKIREYMGEQKLGDDLEKNSEGGTDHHRSAILGSGRRRQMARCRILDQRSGGEAQGDSGAVTDHLLALR